MQRTMLRMGTTYFSQTDGQTKVTVFHYEPTQGVGYMASMGRILVQNHMS